MPSVTEQRRRSILELLESNEIRNQAELRDLLRHRRITTTQATLSRDLRELGVVKGARGYVVPDRLGAVDSSAPESALTRAAQQWLRRVQTVQNQLVLHTPAGGAQPLAVALDRARLDGAVGTIAGDDTILTICDSSRTAKRIARHLDALASAGATETQRG